MVAQVYSGVPIWNSSGSYSINDVVTLNGEYFFCQIPNTNIPPISADSATNIDPFSVPNVNNTVSFRVVPGETSWMTTGQLIFIEKVGYYSIQGIDDPYINVENLGYINNAPVGSFINFSTTISPLNPYWNDESAFKWIPSYSTDITLDSFNKEVLLGDSYSQRYPQGPGSSRFKPFTLKFDHIDDKQADAMSVFLSNPNNNPSFSYLVPSPHNRSINVFCSSWTISKSYDEDHSLTASFEEYLGYQYQPEFIFSEGTNPSIVPEQQIGFVATCIEDNNVHYVTTRGYLYPDVYASNYINASGDVLLPYTQSGNFIDKKSNCYTALLKGTTDNTFLTSFDFYYTYLSVSGSLVSAGQLITGVESVKGYYLDGRVVYLRITTDKIADPNSSDRIEVSTIKSTTSLQFFPFQSSYQAYGDLYSGFDTNPALQNQWAVMPLLNASNMWWKASYFSALTPYGGSVSEIANQTGLGLLTPKTFFTNGLTIGGSVNGYCWLSSGYARYVSSVSGLGGDNIFNAIIPRSILNQPTIIFAQIQMPVCFQFVQDSGGGQILATTSQGTFGGNNATGISGYTQYGNPDRGLSQISFDINSNATCVKGPNFWTQEDNSPIQNFSFSGGNTGISGLLYPINTGIIFDGNKTMCMCTTPYGYDMITEMANLNTLYALLNSGYLQESGHGISDLMTYGFPSGGNLNNSCGLQIIQ